MNLKSLFESPWFKGTEALLAIAASGAPLLPCSNLSVTNPINLIPPEEIVVVDRQE
jgi:hypothetical protein